MVYKRQKVRQSYLGSQNCVKVLKPRVPTFPRKEITRGEGGGWVCAPMFIFSLDRLLLFYGRTYLLSKLRTLNFDTISFDF